MLKLFFHTQLQLGFAQAGLAALAAFAVILLARKREIHLEGELLVAMIRGIVQIIAVGSILLLLLRAPRWTSAFLLAVMIVAAHFREDLCLQAGNAIEARGTPPSPIDPMT